MSPNSISCICPIIDPLSKMSGECVRLHTISHSGNTLTLRLLRQWGQRTVFMDTVLPTAVPLENSRTAHATQ